MTLKLTGVGKFENQFLFLIKIECRKQLENNNTDSKFLVSEWRRLYSDRSFFSNFFRSWLARNIRSSSRLEWYGARPIQTTSGNRSRWKWGRSHLQMSTLPRIFTLSERVHHAHQSSQRSQTFTRSKRSNWPSQSLLLLSLRQDVVLLQLAGQAHACPLRGTSFFVSTLWTNFHHQRKYAQTQENSQRSRSTIALGWRKRGSRFGSSKKRWRKKEELTTRCRCSWQRSESFKTRSRSQPVNTERSFGRGESRSWRPREKDCSAEKFRRRKWRKSFGRYIRWTINISNNDDK